MMEFLWWLVLLIVNVVSGMYIVGPRGGVFMAATSVIGGFFLLFEKKFRPHS